MEIEINRFYITASKIMNFGEATYRLNQELKMTLLQYNSIMNPGRIYEYRKNRSKQLSNGTINEYWLCRTCDNLKRRNGREENELYSNITVSNNLILRDPDIGHHSDCDGVAFGEANAKTLDREARQSCKNGRKRPLEAHTEMTSQAVRRFRRANELDEVEASLPQYRSMKSGLRRWFHKGRIPVADPYDLPLEYTVPNLARK